MALTPYSLGRGGTPPMPKSVKTKADALKALDRYVFCTMKGEDADHRGHNAGGSITGDRHRITAGHWQDKADEALEALRAYLADGVEA